MSEQTYLVSGQSIEIIEGSGTSYIDSMLNNSFGSPIKWVSDPYLNAEYSVNGSTVISYSFPGLLGTTALFNYTDDVGEIVAIPFSAQQAADTRLALAKISEFINVTFVEVEEVGDAVGSIRFGINTITDEEGNYREGIGATADPPGPDPRGGDVWFNKNSVKSQFLTGLVELDVQSYTPFGDTVGLYHEIFHTLGVEHPGDHETIPFPEGKNSTEYTVMAPYTPEDKQLYITDEKIYIVVATPMVYDIAAIQYLYGANMTHNSGDTTYSFDPDTPFIEALWDAGGNDTLDFSNFSKSNTISLVDGEYSTIGFDVDWSMTDNLGIAFDAIIENAIGGSGDDTITGNSSANNIQGGAGNDIIDGGSGIDTAIFKDASTSYTITVNTDGSISVVHSNASFSVTNEGRDTLTNIETLKFTDQTILTSSFTSEQTYLVSGQSIEIIEGSGTSYIDSMFNNAFGSPIKWVSDPYLNAEYSVNGSTVISYSFPGLLGTTALYNYIDDRGEIVAVPFSAQQAADTRLALAKISEFINVTFVEVEEVGDAVGSIRFGINTITDEEGNYREGIAATAAPPSAEPRGGDIWFNKWFTNVGDFSTGLVRYGSGDQIGTQTGVGDVTVLYHEIFHTLGIEHPGDHETIPFPEGKNSREYTVMAGEFVKETNYNIDGVYYVVASTPMVYDIAAIQYLYGANMTHNSGDTTYSFDPDTPFIEAIWDAGGNDTLDFSNFSKSNTISLVDGEYSTIGFDVDWSITDHLGIAFNAIIENAIGGSGDDTITGNSSANNIQGGAGNDIIDGGSGIDTAIFKDSSTSYKITTNTDGSISVVHSPPSDSVTNEGTDSLTNVEYMQFTDKTVASTSLKYSLSASINSSVNILEAHSESAISGTLNFNSGNNIIILDGQATTYRGLEGDDTYFVSQLLPKNSKISITDTSGDNTIQLPANTYIDKSLFTKNATQLTFQDGREVTISGADKFTYNVGGNITDGTDGIDLTFREFADVFGVYDILNTSGAQTGTISDMYIT